jgi:hypothetical protein
LNQPEERILVVIGVLIAFLAACFVLLHARSRELGFWSIVVWVAGTFLVMVVFLPIYIFVHVLRPRQDAD